MVNVAGLAGRLFGVGHKAFQLANVLVLHVPANVVHPALIPPLRSAPVEDIVKVVGVLRPDPLLQFAGLDWIAERLFNELRHDRFLLEYDTERAGGFEPLRFVPQGKIVVLGLVSTKVPETPTVDELRRRIDEAARYLPLEQLALSPQCGFASSVVGNLISEDDQRRKLEAVVETARQVWG